MDIKNIDKEFLLEFIEAYRSFPCLWRIKSNEYKDRNKKSRAYENLLANYQKLDSTATLQTVKTKIDSLRGSFRKELKKIKESQRSGAGEDELYKPHLWYFDNLLFLLDQETPRESISSLETETSVNNDVKEGGESMSPQSQYLEDSNLSTSSASTSTSTLVSTPVLSPSIKKSVRPTLKRKVTKADEILDKVSQQLDVKEDKFDIVGKNLANKLRELPQDIAIITEKLLNDIVFEAQMGNVTRYTSVTLQNSSNNLRNTDYPSSSMEHVQNNHLPQQHFQIQQYHNLDTSQNFLSPPQNFQAQHTTNNINTDESSGANFYKPFGSNIP